MSLLSRLFTSARHTYRRFFKEEENARMSEAVDALGKTHLFQHMSSRALRDLADAVHIRNYRRDEFIYYERDPGLGLYVIQRGRVRLLTEDESGTAHELRKVKEHEAFGVLSLFGNVRRTETAQAVMETRLLGFFRPDLRTMIQRHPRSGAATVMALAQHLSARQMEMLELLGEDSNKVAAMRTLDQALHRIGA